MVTSIGLDHEAWLGSDLDAIGREKAAIARNAKPLLLGPGLPQSVADTGRSLGAQLCAWDAAAVEQAFADLVAPAGLVRSNLVLAARAANELGLQLPQARMLEVLSTLSIAGRCQRIQRDGVEEIHDVAHNLDATTQLANFLQQLPDVGPVTAVFSALQDKAVAELIQPLLAQIDTWCIAAVNDARAMDIKQLEQALSAADSVRKFDSIALALDYARQHAKRVVVCGSFLTVAAAGNESDG